MFSDIFHVLDTHFFNLLFIMVVIWTIGMVLNKIRLPLIAGQLIAGIIIGPAVLNIARHTFEIDILAQLGMFFLMFYAGLKTHPQKMRNILPSSILIGFLGTVFPFCLGFATLYYQGFSLLPSLFIATAISGTSLVTKTRILNDFKLLKSKLGHTMISAAIFDNILSFVILSVLIKYAKTEEMSLSSGMVTALEVITFFSIVIIIGHFLLPKMHNFLSQRKEHGFTKVTPIV
ncbi:MAG: cation:proton antiporter [Chlamydiota bacterium]